MGPVTRHTRLQQAWARPQGQGGPGRNSDSVLGEDERQPGAAVRASWQDTRAYGFCPCDLGRGPDFLTCKVRSTPVEDAGFSTCGFGLAVPSICAFPHDVPTPLICE